MKTVTGKVLSVPCVLFHLRDSGCPHNTDCALRMWSPASCSICRLGSLEDPECNRHVLQEQERECTQYHVHSILSWSCSALLWQPGLLLHKFPSGISLFRMSPGCQTHRFQTRSEIHHSTGSHHCNAVRCQNSKPSAEADLPIQQVKAVPKRTSSLHPHCFHSSTHWSSSHKKHSLASAEKS